MTTTIYPASSVSAGSAAWRGEWIYPAEIRPEPAPRSFTVHHGSRTTPAISSRETCGLHLVRQSDPGDIPTPNRGLLALYRGLYQLADTNSRGPRTPHPSDILYWVTCLGAACLLLLATT